MDERAPSSELLALGARPSGEIEQVEDADIDTAAQQPAPAETEPSRPQTIDLAALEVEPDSKSFWLAVMEQSETDETGAPGSTAGEAVPPADGVEQEPSADAWPQEPPPMAAGSATGEAAKTVPETPQPPPRKTAAAHYRIQIGAYREQENVEWALREAQKLGIEPVASVPTGRAKSPLTAVVVGDFASVCEACRAQCRLETLGWEGYLRRH
jgi:cell division septation protein DedD